MKSISESVITSYSIHYTKLYEKTMKKNEVTVTSSYFVNEIASLPDYQDEYGNGYDQAFGWFFSNWGPSFKEDGPAGWGNVPP